ncbi:ABC transporter permease [Lactococcus garvieae]|uniref:ABC transporter permease n=1 Tax=Lactococcus garvieae TaxID=1363 RepID=UPI0009C0A9BA|nr:ABC transporter permease [Lactococcus garvieae]
MRVKAIFKRILLQRLGDKRSLALLFLAPLVILSLLYFLLQVPSDVKYRVGLESNRADLSKVLKQNDKLDIVLSNNPSEIREVINEQNLDAFVKADGNKIEITYANKDISKTQTISQLITQSSQKLHVQMLEKQSEKKRDGTLTNTPQSSGFRIENHYLYGDSSLSLFENLAPVLVSFFVFFFVFLISGISLVNERTSGTLTRMLVTPVRRSEIVTGYTLAYGLLAFIQTGLIVFWTRYVLQLQVLGNFSLVLVINVLIAIIALLVGLLLSALAKTEFQFIQFVPVAIVPQFLFSGIINVDTMSEPLRWVAHLMPLYYGVDALQKVIKQGMGLADISFNLFLLFIIAALLYVANVFALKTLRKT